MITRILKGRALAAVAGAAMLASTATSAPAMTLSAPSLEPSVAGANIENAYWRHGWGWRGGYGWRGYGWRGYGWRGYGWGYGRHCWRGYYHWHCN
jgi:hypothetical protein